MVLQLVDSYKEVLLVFGFFGGRGCAGEAYHFILSLLLDYHFLSFKKVIECWKWWLRLTFPNTDFQNNLAV